ncbi:ap2-like ethylene-responsive transcription factor plt2, partial [Trifolium pratense]
LASFEDMRLAWSMGTISLKPGVLRLSKWTNDFNPYTQRQTHAQVWIRLMGLPQEYWRQRTLFEIASVIGTPLTLDEATKNHVFGHYARILVGIDLSRHMFDEIMVERDGMCLSSCWLKSRIKANKLSKLRRKLLRLRDTWRKKPTEAQYGTAHPVIENRKKSPFVIEDTVDKPIVVVDTLQINRPEVEEPTTRVDQDISVLNVEYEVLKDVQDEIGQENLDTDDPILQKIDEQVEVDNNEDKRNFLCQKLKCLVLTPVVAYPIQRKIL